VDWKYLPDGASCIFFPFSSYRRRFSYAFAFDVGFWAFFAARNRAFAGCAPTSSLLFSSFSAPSGFLSHHWVLMAPTAKLLCRFYALMTWAGRSKTTRSLL
jgi:hypothetical protein